MKKGITLYYNPRCSKCREALSQLNDKGFEPELVEYLEKPPTQKRLKEILALLGIQAEELVRKTEPIYKEKFQGKSLTDAQWIKTMVENPVLIQRPIIIKGDKAVIGRAPEKITEIIKS